MKEINACFISYRSPGDPGADEYVREFHKVLAVQLRLYLPHAKIFLDQNRLGVGDFYDPKLAKELCKSACMVMLYSPCHFETAYPYCALEYHAMLDLEQKRLPGIVDLQNQGLIFPVVLRGSLPKEISDTRHYLDLSKMIVCAKDFRSRKCQQIIKHLAEHIFARYQHLTNANVFSNGGCDAFVFQDPKSIADWLKNISPIHRFPGR